jgi:golgin subfamily B member 1
MERDDAYTEIEILKEKLDKSLYASQKLIDEKDNSNKEFEKMLEKYDRCANVLFSCKNNISSTFLSRSQNDLYRLQSRIDAAEADRNRLEVETERSTLSANKAREDLRKLQDEMTRLQDACDRAALQLTRSKELEDKAKEDVDLVRERLEKMQTEYRRTVSEKENMQVNVLRLVAL